MGRYGDKKPEATKQTASNQNAKKALGSKGK